MNSIDLVVLTGGTGTVKLLKGFYKLIPEKMVIVTNTGDDFNFYGLKVSPDTDSVLYSLSNLLDETKMWGIKGDSFGILKILQTLDIEKQKVADWFNLGDKDLAHCLYRTHLLTKGMNLTEITELLRKKLSIKTAIFPMTNDEVTTYFKTTDGSSYHFAEFFIRLHSQKPIQQITYVNAEQAHAPKELLDAINQAKLIIIGPSNPITSIGPILAIEENYSTIKKSKGLKIVVSPITGKEAYSGPAKIYMEARGIEVSPLGIYDFYKELADEYYFAKEDKENYSQELSVRAEKDGKKVYFDDIFFPTYDKQLAFANKLIKRYNL